MQCTVGLVLHAVHLMQSLMHVLIQHIPFHMSLHLVPQICPIPRPFVASLSLTFWPPN